MSDSTAPQDPVVTHLQELLRLASVSPDDGGTHKLLDAFYSELGMSCSHHSGPICSTLWAISPPSKEIANESQKGRKPLLVFAGHTDVVPPGEASSWSLPPFSGEIHEGEIYGRGAVDMKGGTAAFNAALSEFVKSHPWDTLPFQVGVIMVTDEETTSKGTPLVLESLKKDGIKIDAALVAEPSSVNKIGDMVKLGRRGSITATITIKGVQGHSAYPDDARNPVHMGAQAIADLCAISWDKGDRLWPATTGQVTNLKAGTGATNVIPESVQLTINVRFSPVYTRESVKELVENVVKKHVAESDLEISWTGGSLPFLTPEGPLLETLEASIKEVTGITPVRSTSGGTSDARFLSAAGIPVFEFGLRHYLAHKVDERVGVGELIQLKQIFKVFLEKCKETPSVLGSA